MKKTSMLHSIKCFSNLKSNNLWFAAKLQGPCPDVDDRSRKMRLFISRYFKIFQLMIALVILLIGGSSDIGLQFETMVFLGTGCTWAAFQPSYKILLLYNVWKMLLRILESSGTQFFILGRQQLQWAWHCDCQTVTLYKKTNLYGIRLIQY